MAAALAVEAKAEGRFNAPLPSPSSYFGGKFELGNKAQIKEWREQVYKGYKGGPSIVHANEILKAAGAEIVPQAELPELIRRRSRSLVAWGLLRHRWCRTAVQLAKLINFIGFVVLIAALYHWWFVNR